MYFNKHRLYITQSVCIHCFGHAVYVYIGSYSLRLLDNKMEVAWISEGFVEQSL